MGVPPVIIHLNRIFPSKNHHFFGVPQFMETPHIDLSLSLEVGARPFPKAALLLVEVAVAVPLIANWKPCERS